MIGKIESNDMPGACASAPPSLLNVLDVAHLLSCSARHVRRLSDSGRMPRPVKLGTLARWKRARDRAVAGRRLPGRASQRIAVGRRKAWKRAGIPAEST